jgi:hypothetical protein
MRRKNSRKKRINTKNLCINEIYEQTINENDRNYSEIIDSNLDENVYYEINYDQLNVETNQTVEYEAV